MLLLQLRFCSRETESWGLGNCPALDNPEEVGPVSGNRRSHAQFFHFTHFYTTHQWDRRPCSQQILPESSAFQLLPYPIYYLLACTIRVLIPLPVSTLGPLNFFLHRTHAQTCWSLHFELWINLNSWPWPANPAGLTLPSSLFYENFLLHHAWPCLPYGLQYFWNNRGLRALVI